MNACFECNCFLLLDYDNLASDEDFLQQLSTELDIPSLFNQGEDGLSVLNSLLSSSRDNLILSASSLESDLKETQEIGEVLKELQVCVFIETSSVCKCKTAHMHGAVGRHEN